MKFFIDTANLDQIREANDLGVLDGVTTNPSLMAKEGIKGVENQQKHYIEICNIVDGDVSAEVIATDYEGMIREGEELAALHPHIVVKVPWTADIKSIHSMALPDSIRILEKNYPLMHLLLLSIIKLQSGMNGHFIQLSMLLIPLNRDRFYNYHSPAINNILLTGVPIIQPAM